MVYKFKLTVLAASAFACLSPVFAEEDSWSLQSCVDYALENNNDVRASKVNQQIAEVGVKSAKGAWQPTLSFSTSQSYSNRPFGSPENSYSGNYNLGANWTIFDGTRQSEITNAKISKQSADQSLILSQYTVAENILDIYMKVLYSDETVKIQQNALETLESQRDRSKGLYKAGSISISDYTQVEAQYSAQNYSVISAQNTARDYRLQLCQLMNAPVDLSLNIAPVDYDSAQVLSPVPDYVTVYQAALAFRPEIKGRELAVEAAETSIKTAKAGYYPTLSLGASIGTANGEKSDFSFGDQLKNNWSNSVGLSLNVPILTGRKNKSAYEQAKLKKSSSEIELVDAKDQLLWGIERVWLSALNAQENYKAAKTKAEAARQSYDLVVKQFEVGLKNPTDLLTQKENYLSALQSMLQAKYTAIYNINLLRFYSGEKFM